jgi:hypothetical protein
MVNDCHFEILGVTRQSTQAEIKKAYLRQIKKWHPDKFQHEPGKLQEALEKSKQINEAFQHLKTYTPDNGNGRSGKTPFTGSKSASKTKGAKPVFHMVKLHSERIWAVGYDAYTRILQVSFYEEGVYHYYEVPETVYTEFRFADSADKYLEKNIASRFRHERL